ncbi:MAG: cell division protein ZapB [Proteobacteria bacterium]|nr:cell division protein ZapB [Pseudomonadota bacterium]
MGLEEIEQFDLLEQKIESLISAIGTLTDQKTTLERKGKGHQAELDSLRNEIETLRTDRELIQKRIASLLDRITECGV